MANYEPPKYLVRHDGVKVPIYEPRGIEPTPKAPQPRLIAGVPFECDPTLPDNVMVARHADGRVERFKIES